jgi:hypothetical protein
VAGCGEKVVNEEEAAERLAEIVKETIVYEQAQQQLVSTFGEAHSGISAWLPFLDPAEVKGLVAAAKVIQQAKATAIRRQQEKIADSVGKR